MKHLSKLYHLRRRRHHLLHRIIGAEALGPARQTGHLLRVENLNAQYRFGRSGPRQEASQRNVKEANVVAIEEALPLAAYLEIVFQVLEHRDRLLHRSGLSLPDAGERRKQLLSRREGRESSSKASEHD